MGAKGSKIGRLENCTLWKTDRSPSCRSVLMLIDRLNLNVKEVEVNMDRGEHRRPELVKMNRLQTLPILKDRNLVLNDSHAILNYLVGRYCKDSSLVPKDVGNKALIDQVLHYHSGVMQPLYQAAVNPIFYRGMKCLFPSEACGIDKCYAELNYVLSQQPYLTGCHLTLAEYCVAPYVSTLDILMTINKMKYPCLAEWLYRVSQEPYFISSNKKGLEDFTFRIDCGPDRNHTSKPETKSKDNECPNTSYSRRSCCLCPLEKNNQCRD